MKDAREDAGASEAAEARAALRAAGRLVSADRGRGPGVLVLCEPGCEELAREACARLARHGFVALAPVLPAAEGDLPSGAERAAVDTGAHGLFCEEATDGARLGVLGFGRGGLLALDAAARGARLAVVVTFGASPAPPADASLAAVDVPVLAVFAGKDPAVDAGEAVALEARLRAEGVTCELRVEPGVEPAYLDPARPDHYDAVAARASWDAALARLRAEL